MEAQREIEALQRVVARTSEYVATPLTQQGSTACAPGRQRATDPWRCSNMVDIFEIAPPKDAQYRAPPTPYGLVGQEARHMRYQSLLCKLSADEEDAAAGARVEWSAEEEDEEDEAGDATGPQRGVPQIRTEPSDALVGNFREAAAAMA